MSQALRNRWEHYQFPPSFVLGFHGCDQSVGEKILSGKLTHLEPIAKDYDWLGTGNYFWEANPQRAMEFAQECAAGRPYSRGTIQKPFVLGAVINLGFCLDLNDSAALDDVENSYHEMIALMQKNGVEIPENKRNLAMRYLDCAVFNFLHKRRNDLGWQSYDTIRGTYREGDLLYKGTDIHRKNHIQICVRNTASILGYFRPVEL